MADLLGVDTPGVDTPGVDTPGVDTPGVDTPGVDTPRVDPFGTGGLGADAFGTGPDVEPERRVTAGTGAGTLAFPRATCGQRFFAMIERATPGAPP